MRQHSDLDQLKCAASKVEDDEDDEPLATGYAATWHIMDRQADQSHENCHQDDVKAKLGLNSIDGIICDLRPHRHEVHLKAEAAVGQE